MAEQSLKDLKVVRFSVVDILGLDGDLRILLHESIPLARVDLAPR